MAPRPPSHPSHPLYVPSAFSKGSVRWGDIVDAPTSLSGYGITDAYTIDEADAEFLTSAEADALFLTPAEGDAAYAALSHTHAASELTDWPADDAGVLTNDGAGNLTWEAAGGGGPGSGTPSVLPKWDGAGTALEDSVLVDDATSAYVGSAAKRRVTLGLGPITARFDDNGLASALTFINADFSSTAHGVRMLFKGGYEDNGTPIDAGSIAVFPEQNWTSTTSTQDAFLQIGVAIDGNLSEKARFGTTAMLLSEHLTFPHNTYDIGASGDTSPRSIYFGTSLFRGSTKVLGAQGAAIANTNTNTTTLQNTVNAILGRLRDHGIIAT